MRAVGRKLGHGKGAWLAGAAVIACLSPGAAMAQAVWNGGSGPLWTTPGNWTPAAVPVAGSTVTINGASPSSPTVTVAGQAATSLALTGNTLSLTGSGTLAVSGAVDVTNATLQLGAGAATGAFSAGSLTLNGGGVFRFDHGQGGGLTYAGVISGAGQVEQDSGLTVLTAANTYDGGTSINGGTLRATDGAALGTGALSVAFGATLEVDLGGPGFFVTGALSGAGDVALQNDAIFIVDSTANSTFSGAITGTGSFEKDSSGVLTLTGTSNITGDLTACCGTITVSGGSFTLGGTVAVYDTLNVTNGGDIIATGLFVADNGGTTVTGTGSTLTVGGMFVGGADGAGLRVQNGGAVISNGSVAVLPAFSNSGIFVEDAGSTFTINGALSLFSGQPNFVTVRGGGALTVVNDTLSLDTGTRLDIGTGGLGGTVTAFDIDGDGLVAFNHTDTVTLATPITGSISVTKAGTGAAILTGTNTYTGTTAVNAGTLRVNGALGATAVSVASGGTLGGSGSITGPVTVANGGAVAPGNSAGTLTTGALTLDATSQLNFELATAGVAGGGVNDLLVVNGALTLDGVLNVTNLGNMGAGVYRLIDYTGVLTDNVLTVGVLPAGLAPGEAAVQTATANQVNLLVTGNPTPVGGGGGGSSLGDTLFWDGAGPAADGRIQGGDGIWSAGGANWTTVNGTANGAFTPGGMAIFQGTPGTVTVDGPVSVGAMQFAAGGYRLIGSPITLAAAQTPIRVGDGTSAGAAMTAVIEAPLTGSGGLVKRDAGTLTLAGTNSYTGGTVVEGGTLRVDGSVGAVTVLAGGTLQGRGRIGGLTLGGTIAPGNSIGVTTIGGNFVQQAGSVYQVEIDPTGASDRIVVQGTATIQSGSTVSVSPASGFYAAGTAYTILTASGGVSGTYSALTQDLPFLDLSLSYTGGSVTLNVTRNGTVLADVAASENQRQAAQGAGGPVTAALASLNRADARAAFDALSGEIHASAKGAMIEDSRYLRDAISARTTDGQNLISLSPAPRLTYWAQAFGAWGRTDSDGNAARLGHDVHGVFLGGDYRLSDDWIAGLATGLSHDDLELSARASSADISTVHLAAYASGGFGAWSVDFGAAYSWHDVETGRRVVFAGFADAASADYSADTAQVFAEVRRDWRGLNPFVSLAHVRVDGEGFVETGGAAALAGDGHGESATFATLGLHPALKTQGAALSGTVAWRRLLDDVTPSESLCFQAGGTGFTAQGTPLGRDSLILEGQASRQVWSGAHAAIGYSGQLSRQAQDHSIKASFTAAF